MKVREDDVIRPDGSQGIYTVVETQDSVVVIAENETKEICFIKAYRYPNSMWAWRLPGGGGAGHEPIQAGMRQLAEETGFIASEYHLIGTVRLHGLMQEKLHIVVMRELRQTGENHQQQMGIDTMRFQPISEVEQAIGRGEIDDSQTITAIYLYKSWLQQP